MWHNGGVCGAVTWRISGRLTVSNVWVSAFPFHAIFSFSFLALKFSRFCFVITFHPRKYSWMSTMANATTTTTEKNSKSRSLNCLRNAFFSLPSFFSLVYQPSNTHITTHNGCYRLTAGFFSSFFSFNANIKMDTIIIMMNIICA